MLKKVVMLVGLALLFTYSIMYSVPGSPYFSTGGTYYPQSFSPSEIDPRDGASIDIQSTKLALQYTDAKLIGRGGLSFVLMRTLHYGQRPYYWIREQGHGWDNMFWRTCNSPPLYAGWWQYNIPFIVVTQENFDDEYYAISTYVAGDGTARCFPLWWTYADPLDTYSGHYDAYLDGSLSITENVNHGCSFQETAYLMKPNGDLYIFERRLYKDFDTFGYDGYVFRLKAITHATGDDTIKFIYNNDDFDRLICIKTAADSIVFKYTQDSEAILDTIIRPDGSKLIFGDYVTQSNYKALGSVTDEETELTTRFTYKTGSLLYFRPESVITFNGAETYFTYTEDSLLAKKVIFDPVSNTKDSTTYSNTLYEEPGYNDSLIVIETRNNSYSTKHKFLEYFIYAYSEDTLTTMICKINKTPTDSVNYFWEGRAYWGPFAYGSLPALKKTLTYRFGNSYSDSFDYPQDCDMFGNSYNSPYISYYKDPLGNIYNNSYFTNLTGDPYGYSWLSCLPETTYYPNDSKIVNVYDVYESYYTHCKLEERYFEDSQDNSIKLAEYFYDEHGNDTMIVNVLGDTAKFYYKDVLTEGEHFMSYHNVFSTRTTDPLLQNVHRGYNENTGYLCKQADKNGNITRYYYDGIGRITKVIRPGDSSDSPTLSYSYDDNNREKYVTIKREEGNITTYCYTYNSFGQLISLQEIGGGAESYYYDPQFRKFHFEREKWY